jgi:hypothetical protein
MRTAIGFALCALSFTAAAMETASAQARCRIRDLGRPQVTQSRDGTLQVQLDSGQTSCQATLGAGGRADYQTTSVSVVSPAKGGTVAASSNGFTYSGRAGASGPDSFTLKICGKNKAESGCANVTYQVVR